MYITYYVSVLLHFDKAQFVLFFKHKNDADCMDFKLTRININ